MPQSDASAPPAPARSRLAHRPLAVVWLRAALVASLVGPILLLAYVGWTTHDRALAEGRARLARLAQIAQEQALRIVETNEVIARSAQVAVEGRDNESLVKDRQRLHELLRGLTQDIGQLQSVWIWDDQGRPIATNLRPDPPASLDISDREYFQGARRSTDRAWYVSGPLRSRTTGQVFFDFSKRRTLPDGRFAGVISVSLLPAYFVEFFREQVGHEAGYSMTLLRADGILISRFPESTDGARLGGASPLLAAMQSGSASGATEGVSTIDGTWRYVAYRRVGTLPLYTAATARHDLLLKSWRSSMLVLSAFTLPMAIGLAGLCWFALRRVRREHAIALAHEEEYDQRLRAEEALRQAQKMEALGRLTGGVAHDFNNILMVVQSNVAVVRKLEERGRPVTSALAPIERAVANGAQLTRQLLAIARRQPLEVRPVRLQEVLPEVSQLMRSTLGSRVQIDCEISAEAGTVTLDQAELELAVINLCINARDAMPEGGRIAIRAGSAAPPGDAVPATPWVHITVADTGEGIPVEYLDRVTEPFFTTKPHGKGTGLGLSQVQSFVQQSGGRLRVSSEVGQGTTITLLLPCAAVAGAPAPVVQTQLRSLAGHVLLVEDNDDIATSLMLLLEHAGATVSRYAKAEEAFEAIATTAPDAVLSDILLAGAWTGVDLARRISQQHPALPVVLMTGYTDRLHEAVGLGLRVLPKPADPDKLIDALASALGAKARAAG